MTDIKFCNGCLWGEHQYKKPYKSCRWNSISKTEGRECGWPAGCYSACVYLNPSAVWTNTFPPLSRLLLFRDPWDTFVSLPHHQFGRKCFLKLHFKLNLRKIFVWNVQGDNKRARALGTPGGIRGKGRDFAGQRPCQHVLYSEWFHLTHPGPQDCPLWEIPRHSPLPQNMSCSYSST